MIMIAARKSPWFFSLMFIFTTEPPFSLGVEPEDSGGVPEWVVSFLTSFGSYLVYTGVWCGFKAGLDVGELAFCSVCFS